MTQESFAEHVGISTKHLGGIERGRPLKIETLEEIVKRMGMKPDHFLLLAARFTNPGPPLTPRNMPNVIKSAEVAADALEGLVGVLDGILSDFKTRLDEYHKTKEGKDQINL